MGGSGFEVLKTKIAWETPKQNNRGYRLSENYPCGALRYRTDPGADGRSVGKRWDGGKPLSDEGEPTGMGGNWERKLRTSKTIREVVRLHVVTYKE